MTLCTGTSQVSRSMKVRNRRTMPRRKLIRPAEPLTPPEPGSLEENIWLGDQVAVHANPVAQLRWYDRRGELLIAIQNRNKNAERIAELEKKVKELETQPPVP